MSISSILIGEVIRYAGRTVLQLCHGLVIATVGEVEGFESISAIRHYSYFGIWGVYNKLAVLCSCTPLGFLCRYANANGGFCGNRLVRSVQGFSRWIDQVKVLLFQRHLPLVVATPIVIIRNNEVL